MRITEKSSALGPSRLTYSNNFHLDLARLSSEALELGRVFGAGISRLGEGEIKLAEL